MDKHRRRLENLLQYKMTEEIRLKIESSLEDQDLTDEEVEEIWRGLSKRRHLTRAREELAWYPRIDKEKCTNCRICADFCPQGVYGEMDGELELVAPYSCVFLCSHCSRLCPQKAIEFPDREDFVGYVEYY